MTIATAFVVAASSLVVILVFNCGSSTLKFATVEVGAGLENVARIISHGLFEQIGSPAATAKLTSADGKVTETAVPASDYRAAAHQALDWLAAELAQSHLDAIVHRVVHGGPHIFAPVLLDDAVMRALDEATAFAPLHNPPAITTIRAVAERFPGVQTVIAADTAFHHAMPAQAYTYALPRELARRHGLRRFGFHGLGHAWMLERYAALTGRAPESLNLITLHLGAGCSAAAIRGGKSVDTSMGLTPLEGLMMATRSGDLDPAIVTWLCEHEKLSPRDVEAMLNHQSGLLGVSGVSADLRAIVAAAEAGNRDARLAIDLFCYRVRKYIGQYLAVPEATAAIIFGGGIGEHAAEIRGQICRGLEHLGIHCDEARNRVASGHEKMFSTDASPIALWVIPVDEERYMARAAARLLTQSA